jgi:hypothetical protein
MIDIILNENRDLEYFVSRPDNIVTTFGDQNFLFADILHLRNRPYHLRCIHVVQTPKIDVTFQRPT